MVEWSIILAIWVMCGMTTAVIFFSFVQGRATLPLLLVIIALWPGALTVVLMMAIIRSFLK